MTESEYLESVARASMSRIRSAWRDAGTTCDEALRLRSHIRRHPVLATSLAAAGGTVFGFLAVPTRLLRTGKRFGLRFARLFVLRNMLDLIDE